MKTNYEHTTSTSQNPSIGWKLVDYHPHDQIIGNLNNVIKTKKFFREDSNMAMIYQNGPKSLDEATIYESWVEAKQ